MLSTPNNNMCWRPKLDFPPHHLSRFTNDSIKALLAQLGMNVISSFEQMSIYDLTRHYVGTFFRDKQNSSMRGGEFKNKKLTTILRRIMNKMRKVFVFMLMPVDLLLYFVGFRYISQVVIAEKNSAI